MAQMRRRIADGRWRAGEMLPGRRALAVEYGVALATLERAVAVLMSDGLLRSDNGRGTFVTPMADSLPPEAVEPAPGICVATVALVAAIPQERFSDGTSGLLPILRACEDRLGMMPGITLRFINALAPDRTDRAHGEVVAELGMIAPDVVVLIDQFGLRFVEGTLANAAVIHVLFDLEEDAALQVTVDEAYGGMQAARHLLRQGYAPLRYFHPFRCNWSESRLAGVRRAVGGVGVPPPDVQPGKAPPMPGEYAEQHRMAFAAARRLLRDRLPEGVGIVAPNDAAATGFIKAAAERGIRAGSDYGIIGFDDYERWADLSSMRPPLEQLGVEAARLAERVLRDEAGPSRIMVHHRLIPRGSTRRRKGAPSGA